MRRLCNDICRQGKDWHERRKADVLKSNVAEPGKCARRIWVLLILVFGRNAAAIWGEELATRRRADHELDLRVTAGSEMCRTNLRRLN